jgi:protein-arginine kinase activator protein McsA
MERNFPKNEDLNKFNKIVEEFETPTHIIVKETWKSVDGSKIYQRTTHTSKFSKSIPENVDALKAKMKEAIEKEDFESAANLRDKIREIENRK